jgi:adenylosuccinate lyase
MIDRYARPDMSAVWSEQGKYQRWLEVELAVCEVQAERGMIPAEAAAEIRERAGFDVARIAEIEAEVRHDVIAFTTNVAEHVGPASRWIHYGMTSSDVLDTALALQMRDAGRLILAGIDAVCEALKARAEEFRHTPCVGRTHGVHAEPMTFGLKFLIFYGEMRRNRARVEAALRDAAVGKISGAVGTFAHLDPEVEQAVCQRLGIGFESAASQVVQRDRHAAFVLAVSLTGATLEKIAVEFRHLARTEVREVEEEFGKSQKGSSAMPHKRNPVLTENLTGLARLVRMAVVPAMENVALWHERDISHSSVERMIGPDATITLDFALNRLTGVIDKLVIYPKNMMNNLNKFRGLVHSQRVLLALTQKGVNREDAYRLVQRSAMKVWEEGKDFLTELKSDPDVKAALSDDEIEEKFDLGYHTKHVDTIFARVFGET